MTTMAFMLHAKLCQRVENRLAVVKIFIQVQNKIFRQLLPFSVPTGLLLRFAAA